LFLILALKIYFDTLYRDVIIILDYHTSIVEQLLSEYIPHFKTVQKFMKRMKVKGHEYVFRKALLMFKKCLKMKCTGLIRLVTLLNINLIIMTKG